MAFIESFTRPFMLAVMLWPFLSFVLTLPVLALLYHRDNRIRFTSALTAYLIVLYLLALACFTTYPMPEDPIAYCAVHHLQPQLNPFEFIHDMLRILTYSNRLIRTENIDTLIFMTWDG